MSPNTSEYRHGPSSSLKDFDDDDDCRVFLRGDHAELTNQNSGWSAIETQKQEWMCFNQICCPLYHVRVMQGQFCCAIASSGSSHLSKVVVAESLSDKAIASIDRLAQQNPGKNWAPKHVPSPTIPGEGVPGWYDSVLNNHSLLSTVTSALRQLPLTISNTKTPTKSFEMKHTIILTLLMILARQAFGHHMTNHPKAYTEGEWEQILKDGFGHCSTPGKPCSIGKRAALAVAQAISFPDPKGRKGFCPDSRFACIDPRAAVPDLRPMAGRAGFCSVPGMSCARKRDALNKIGRAAEGAHYRIWAREAAAETAAEVVPRQHPKMGFCAVIGMACMGYRDIESRSDRIGWCSSISNTSCLVDRAAAPGVDVVSRTAVNARGKSCSTLSKGCNQEVEAKQPSHQAWCSLTGLKCSDRREALDGRLSSDKRFAFCGVPGSTCTEKREIDDFEELGLSSIEGKNHTNFVRNLVDGLQRFDPEFDNRECYAEHGPCSDILKARDAFKAIKDQEHTAGTPQLPDADIAEAARAHLSIRHLQLAREAEASCYGPDGACTNAKRAIEELEVAINEAVALL
nr:hypothetical protein CFP56_04099 [Quercus suber]